MGKKVIIAVALALGLFCLGALGWSIYDQVKHPMPSVGSLDASVKAD